MPEEATPEPMAEKPEAIAFHKKWLNKKWIKILGFSLLGLAIATSLAFVGYKLGQRSIFPELGKGKSALTLTPTLTPVTTPIPKVTPRELRGKNGLFFALSDNQSKKLSIYLIDFDNKSVLKQRTIDLSKLGMDLTPAPSSYGNWGANNSVQYNPEKELVVINLERRDYMGGRDMGEEFNAFYITSFSNSDELKQIYKTEKIVHTWVVNSKNNSLIISSPVGGLNGGVEDFWEINLANGEVKKITSISFKEHEGVGKLLLSTDGSYLYQAAKYSPGGSWHGEELYLYKINLVNGEVDKKLVYKGDGLDYDTDNLSFDERKIVFSVIINNNDKLMIKDLATDASEEHEIDLSNTNIFWGKSNNEFLYFIKDGAQKTHFMIYNTSDKQSDKLYFSVSNLFTLDGLFWGPKSNLIYFAERQDSTSEFSIKSISPASKQVADLANLKVVHPSAIVGLEEY